ncbi:MAG TPA: TonB family protein [Thermoanaerobaculia bacterium]|jgi:protein TonB|nr:TonB family protein [Thermoanaerobaculia bacterium]
MFETSVVHARVAERRYSLLSVSLAAHSLVVIAVLAASITSFSFPKMPPPEYRDIYGEAPPPPPPAAPRQPVQPRPAAATPAIVPHAALTPMPLTPSQIPNTIPNVTPSSNGAGPAIGSSTTPGTGGGSDIGDPNSVDIGQPAANTTPVPDTVFHPGAEVRPAVVMHRVEPEYPRAALIAHMSGTVVVKCIVDKDGNVRDAEVVTSSFGAFNAPVLNALQQWRFAPGSFRGKAVDTWFELTIRFQPR